MPICLSAALRYSWAVRPISIKRGLARTGILRRCWPTRARSPMSEPRVIKKYPNRRLYDTVESRYITLTDVKRLVVEKIGFIVVDKKNNADITGSILLQVISDQEHQGDPLMNREFMTQLIRAYGASQH